MSGDRRNRTHEFRPKAPPRPSQLRSPPYLPLRTDGESGRPVDTGAPVGRVGCRGRDPRGARGCVAVTTSFRTSRRQDRISLPSTGVPVLGPPGVFQVLRCPTQTPQPSTATVFTPHLLATVVRGRPAFTLERRDRPRPRLRAGVPPGPTVPLRGRLGSPERTTSPPTSALLLPWRSGS